MDLLCLFLYTSFHQQYSIIFLIEIFPSLVRVVLLEFQKHMIKRYLVSLPHYVKWYHNFSLCQTKLSWPGSTLHMEIPPLPSINSTNCTNLKMKKKMQKPEATITTAIHASPCHFPLLFLPSPSSKWSNTVDHTLATSTTNPSLWPPKTHQNSCNHNANRHTFG